MLAARAPRAGRVDGELVRWDGDLCGDAQRTTQGIMVGRGPWHGKGRVRAIDFAAMTGPSRPEDNLPLGERLARRWLDDWRGAAVLVVLLALASSITSLANGFAYDDVAIVLENKRIHDWRTLWRLFVEPYWLIDSFPRDLYRPIVLLAFGVEWAVGGGDPLVFHAVNVLLYVAVSVAFLALLRQLIATRAALVGAALWAVHPVHVESVGNVVGQAELLVAVLVLSALVLFVRDRRRGRLAPRTVVCVSLLYAGALLTKEHAIVFPGLLLAAEAALRRSGAPGLGDAVSRFWLLLRILLWVSLAFLLIRFTVLGGFGGNPHFSLWGLTHAQRLLAASALWPEVGRLMVWPARLYADYAPPQFPVRTTLHPSHLVAFLLLLTWLLGLRWAWMRRNAVAIFGLLAFPVAFSVTSNLLFPTGVLIAERALFLPSISVGLLAAVLFAGLGQASRRIRQGASVLVAVLVVAGASRSAARQTAWADSVTVFSTMVVESPQNGRGHAVIGQLFFGFGEFERAERHLATAYALHDGYGYLYASFLERRGRCREALPLAEALAGKYRSVQPLQVTRIVCLFEARRFSDARRHARDAVVRGLNYVKFHDLAQVADSLLASYDSADARNTWIRSGKPFDRTGADVKVAIAPGRLGGGVFGLIFGGRPEARR